MTGQAKRVFELSFPSGNVVDTFPTFDAAKARAEEEAGQPLYCGARSNDWPGCTSTRLHTSPLLHPDSHVFYVYECPDEAGEA